MRNAKGMQLTSKFINRRLAIKEKKEYFVRANENKLFIEYQWTPDHII